MREVNSMKDLIGGIFGSICVLCVILVPTAGWVANIVKLAHMGLDPLTSMLILRFIGIPIFFLGAVLGFL